jgi:hypothetical protein
MGAFIGDSLFLDRGNEAREDEPEGYTTDDRIIEEESVAWETTSRRASAKKARDEVVVRVGEIVARFGASI